MCQIQKFSPDFLPPEDSSEFPKAVAVPLIAIPLTAQISAVRITTFEDTTERHCRLHSIIIYLDFPRVYRVHSALIKRKHAEGDRPLALQVFASKME